jgi:hypothetical protein
MRLRRFGGRRQLAPGRRGHPDRLARLDNFNLLALISCDAGQLAEILLVCHGSISPLQAYDPHRGATSS